MTRTIKLLGAAVALASTAAFAVSGDAEAGKVKAAQCAACHGAEGNSASADFPRLAGQHSDYLAASLLHYKNGKRKNAIMSGFAANLSSQDIADLAAYFSHQNGLYVRY